MCIRLDYGIRAAGGDPRITGVARGVARSTSDSRDQAAGVRGLGAAVDVSSGRGGGLAAPSNAFGRAAVRWTVYAIAPLRLRQLTHRRFLFPPRPFWRNSAPPVRLERPRSRHRVGEGT